MKWDQYIDTKIGNTKLQVKQFYCLGYIITEDI